ncbi:integrase [Streptomyces lunaelactis]|uniref:integrase n=1 Tax=Streptomyces lunaelactis TaxID=1535768 RepID=UPI00158583E8|nr:integrase [Streptomyces lunaelactis]NUL03312.1 integrase [Streptomyces lunaelactis]
MTTAPDLDPYLLPMPGVLTPVVPDEFLVSVHAHLNARYTARIWPLAPLSENPSARAATIHWRHCPDTFDKEIRLAAWNLINGQLRPTFLKERNRRMRPRVSARRTADTVYEWFRLAAWLTDRGLDTLGACDSSVLHAYGQHLLGGRRKRLSALDVLTALTRLWAFDQMSARPAGIGRPPWDELGVDDYLPAEDGEDSSGGENKTEPLSEKTMGPLLIWAMRLVDDFADDILAAWAERQHLTETARTAVATPATRAALDAYLGPLIAAGAPLPAIVHMGETTLARTYVMGVTGAAGGQVDRLKRLHGLATAAAERPGPCPLRTPITGRINGKPWREAIDFNDAAELMRHLGTASFMVLSYLTGMRPGEVLGLRTGCCPDPEPDDDGKVGRHLIRGHAYKTARDEHGNHQSAGTEREVPWVAIAPVVNTIRVLERMVPDGHLLFDHSAHDLRIDRTGTGSLKHTTLRLRVEDFVTWANAEARTHQLPGETIPPDPHGRIGTGRFRRSLAWHIARRPNGLVALAIQYGHLRTTVSAGYASRGRGGIDEMVNIETVRAVADTVASLHGDLEAGGGVSGPAARRAIRAAAHAPRFEGTVITATTARRLLANEDAILYDNPQALLLCHYRREQALCHRDGVKDAPSLNHCVEGCGNIVRTDQHAALLRQRADMLHTHAAHAPQPIGDRLRANAIKLRSFADTHDRTRITLQEATG